MIDASIDVPELRPRPWLSGLRPVRTRKWLDQLPLADLERAAEQAAERLSEVNQIRWSPKDRLQGLIAFATPVRFLQQSLSKKYLNLAVPLRGRPAQRAQLCIALQTRMVSGYRVVLEQDMARLDRTTTARACHDYLLELGELLLQLSQLYLPLPESFWRQAHESYAWACKRNVQREAPTGYLTIEILYKRLMTLGATDLRRFRQSEQSAIYAVLGDWCENLKLAQTPPTRASSMLVQFATDRNEAPRRVGPADGGGRGELMVMDISELTRNVRHLLLSAESDNPATLDADLNDPCLRRLLRIWEGPWRRQFPRSPATGEARMTVGLAEIHRGLASDSGDGIYQRATFEAEDGKAHWVQPGDPWARTPYVAQDQDSDQEIDTDPKQAEHPDWHLVDSSAGGLCLAKSSGGSGLLRIGDLVYVEVRDDVPSLGVVRWMQCGFDDTLEVGIQILAAQPAAAIVSPARRGSAMAPSMRVAENRALQLPPTLVTPQFPFQEGMAVKLFADGDEQRLRLVRLIENTGAFNQFRIEPEPLTGSPKNSDDAEAAEPRLRLWPQAPQ